MISLKGMYMCSIADITPNTEYICSACTNELVEIPYHTFKNQIRRNIYDKQRC